MADTRTGPRITGATGLYVLIGDPIAQVRAPALVNPLLAARGVDAVLVPARVSQGDLTVVAGALQRVPTVRGLLVTVPHKRDVLSLADTVSPRAVLSGSANALRRDPDGRWHADNFDGTGFTAGLGRAGCHLRGRRVCLVGAGGAGSAIAVALLEAGVARLRIADPGTDRLGALRGRLTERFPGRTEWSARPRLDDVELAVNATPLGLRPGDPLPFDPAGLPAGGTVADIVMDPAETALLAAARRAGHRVHAGRHTLESQLDSYATFFGW
ncbi:shikimate dehydrogenase [Actinoplanes sp. DH11]|uniref:shikimate dehydrogenase family protein n=1 Tax=Actinoplanes sp. DH11 TaxID=2857011 RepID=UPI001E64D1BA|nr:shikimate dehydrogenase [Actinoplanes sp. DH11]